jgi:FlaA1/EpsC-like NDP-sugar epimerase
VLGTRHEIPALVDKHNVALIVLALHNITGQELRAILNICERTNAVIKSIPDLYGLLNAPNSMMLRDVQPEDLLGRSLVTRHAEVDLSPVTEKDVLISGAAGSIGSELSRQIMDFSPRRVILLDNNESGLHDLTIELRARFPSVTIEPVLVDVSNGAALERAFAQSSPQVIFHAAAYKHVPMLESSPYEALRVNVGGTANMTRLAARFGVERFVFISTDKAVNPSSVMGASKRLGELMLHACRQQGGTTLFTAVRFGNVLGSRGSVVPTFTRQIQNGGPVTITDREMTRYFMTIPEAVNLIIHAACLTCGDDIFLLHMGEVVRIVDLAERMIRLRGLRPYIDIDIVPTGIRPGEKLHEELYTSDEKLKDTIHPGIVQIESWHGQFDRDTFWRHIDSLGNQTGDAPVVLGQLLRVIRFGENGHHVPDMVEAPVPSTSVTSA